MANQEHVEKLKAGIPAFNQWKAALQTGALDLSQSNLSGLDLSGADLSNANLSGADLSNTNLNGADVTGANLEGIKLNGPAISKISLQGDLEHGKTALLAALTQQEYEHKNRAVVVMKGNQPFVLMDAISQADRLKQMEENNVSAVLLVVSLPDGPESFAKEVIEKAAKIKIPRVLVFLNKRDLIDDGELIELVQMEVETLLEDSNFSKEGCLFNGSALKALDRKSTEDMKPVKGLLAAF